MGHGDIFGLICPDPKPVRKAESNSVAVPQ